MSLEKFITKVLNVKPDGIQKMTSIEEENGSLTLKLWLKPKNPQCPVCGGPAAIHGYYSRRLNHATFANRRCTIIYQERRYKCKICNLTFHEDNPFINTSEGLTYETKINILKDLKYPGATYTNVARRYNISVTKVLRIFDSHVRIPRKPLPEILSVDEHYFPSSDYEALYCCLLMDFKTGVIIDVLPDRRQDFVSHYLTEIKKNTWNYTLHQSELDNVKYVSTDLHEPFRNLAKAYFPKAKICADSFHVIKNLTNCFRNILIRCRKQAFSEEMVYLIFKFRHVFYHNANLDNKAKYNRRLKRYLTYRQIRDLAFATFPELAKAYELKEYYINMNSSCTASTAAKMLEEAIDVFGNSGIIEYEPFATLLINWREEIINSFTYVGDSRINNSHIESKNRMLERLMYNANGFRNFDRTRNRILYCLNRNETYTL